MRKIYLLCLLLGFSAMAQLQQLPRGLTNLVSLNKVSEEPNHFVATASVTPCTPPEILETTVVGFCGIGEAKLSATATSGVVKWYSTATGGPILAKGNSYTTPEISTNTSYWVEATTPRAADQSVGKKVLSTSFLTAIPLGLGLVFNAFDVVDLQSVTIYVRSDGEATTGLVNIGVYDNYGQQLYETGNLPITMSSEITANVIPLNFSVPEGNKYGLRIKNVSNALIAYENSGVTFPYVGGDGNLSITSSYYDQGEATFFVALYDIKYKGDCASSRQEVVATRNAAPTLNLSASNIEICKGETSSAVTIITGKENYDTYEWVPNTNVSGNAITGWTFNPTVDTKYTLKASQSSGFNCKIINELNVKIKPDGIIGLSIEKGAICNGEAQEIVAFEGLLSGVSNNITSSNSTSTYPNPVSGYYGGTKTQLLFTKEELLAMGLRGGATINSISFDINVVSSNVCEDFTIRLGSTTRTQMGSGLIDYTTLTTVYNKTFKPTESGWANFVFMTPYVWDGTNNLVLETVFNAGILYLDLGTTIRYTPTSFTSSATVIADNIAPAGVESFDLYAKNASVSTSVNRPNTLFGYSNGSNSYKVVWSPIAGLYTDAAATIPYTGTAVNKIYAKPNVATDYIATAVNISDGICSHTRKIKVNPVSLLATTVANQYFCQIVSTKNIIVTADSGALVSWYANSTGGLPIKYITTTGTYYVQTEKQGCISDRVPVLITINRATTTSTQTFCLGATVADLDATGTDLKWYNSATATVALSDTTALVAGTYYVTQTLNNCEGPKTAVEVTVYQTTAPTATAQTFCIGATVAELDATGTDLKWYSSATATTNLSGATVLATGTYYVTQTLNGCESPKAVVEVTVYQTLAPTATAQTFCHAGTVANLTATGADLKWYSSVTATTTLSGTTALATGNYYVTQTLNGCESPKTTVQVTVYATSMPVVADQAFCIGATIADVVITTGTAVKWYSSATATVALPATTVLAGASYYVTQTLNGCESYKKEVKITIYQTVAPTVSDQAFCHSGTVAGLVATGQNLKWYSSATATTSLTLATALATGTYYVSQTLNNCEGPKTAFQVTVHATPAPTVVDQAFCDAATIANLQATGTAVKWYSSATSTIALGAATALNTGTYYVTQTLNSCESIKKAVQVTIHQTPAPTAGNQAFCDAATVANLQATGAIIKWYDSATATMALTSTTALINGATYYATQTLNGCESPRKAVVVTIYQTPAPAAVDQVFCIGATVGNLVADGVALKWYSGTTSASLLTAATILTDASTYYVTQTLNGCESPRKAITVTVHHTPAPIAMSQIVCAKTLLSALTATGTNLKWYATNTSTTTLSMQTALATGTYYVSQTLNNCESIRTAVQVTVKDLVLPPVVKPLKVCYATPIVELDEQLDDTGTIIWYATETATTALADNTILVSGTYYASRTFDGCESARAAFVVKVIPFLSKPVSYAQTFCGKATVNDLVASYANGATLEWFANASLTTPLSGTAVLNSGIYYVRQMLEGCVSESKAVTVKVISTVAPAIAAYQFCGKAKVSQLAFDSPIGITYKWYVSLSSPVALTTTTDLATGTYYVSRVEEGCESARGAVSVTILEIPAAPTGAAVQLFLPGATTADIVMDQPNVVWYKTYYDAIMGMNPLSYVKPIENGTTYYAVIYGSNGCPSLPTPIFIDTATLGNEVFQKEALKYYPNPVTEVLYIEYVEVIDAIEIYDLTGRSLHKQTNAATTATLDVSALASATYMVRISSGKTHQLIKIVKK